MAVHCNRHQPGQQLLSQYGGINFRYLGTVGIIWPIIGVPRYRVDLTQLRLLCWGKSPFTPLQPKRVPVSSLGVYALPCGLRGGVFATHSLTPIFVEEMWKTR